MNDSRPEFDRLSKEFGEQYKKFDLSDITKIEDDKLKLDLLLKVDLLTRFTQFYNEFEVSIISNVDIVSFKAYRDRALTFVMICQNQFITPITNELTNRNNYRLQTLANESIKLGQDLLKEANKSSKFAKRTFWTALIISILTFVISIVMSEMSSRNSEEILDNNTKILERIEANLNFLKEENTSQDAILNNKNKIMTIKLDSLIKKIGGR